MAQAKPTVTEIETAMASLSAFNVTDLAKSFAMDLIELRYEGFDPKFLLAILLQRGRKRADAEEVLDIGNITVKKGEDKFILIELNTLAFVAAMRGSKLDEKILKKTGQTGAAWLTKMKTLYNLKQGKSLKSEDASLLRILAIFSHSVVVGVHTGQFEPAVTLKSLGLTGVSPAICCSVFGSMIPIASKVFPEADRTLLIHAWMFHQVVFDRLINRKDNHSSKSRLEQYAQIQLDQSFHPQVRRQTVLAKCDILTRNGALNENCRKSLTDMAARWENFSF
uniref:Nucleoprotein n=1 Tax=Cryptocercus pudacuoensis phenuivirus 1 TaxID=3133456 RepID=A0AAT9JFH8_9VIRU